MTRRDAVSALTSWALASPLVRAQQQTPMRELVNSLEMEAEAKRKLAPEVFAEIAGSDRAAFDRITFRPRMMVDTTRLDLGLDLFGQKHFAPILVGPAAKHARFHSDAELATARGAAVAKATMIIADQSSASFDKIASATQTPFWFQVNAEGDVDAARGRAEHAVRSGAKALCLTTTGADQGWSWQDIDRFRRELTVPLLLKGVVNPEEARAAADRGLQGIIVSSYRPRVTAAMTSPIAVLPGVADAVAGKTPILIDGGFRRGTDILKALALGARAVLLGRPPLWGLAAYGADGVQYVVEMLQTELARAMAMCGAPDLAHITRAHVRLHRP